MKNLQNKNNKNNRNNEIMNLPIHKDKLLKQGEKLLQNPIMPALGGLLFSQLVIAPIILTLYEQSVLKKQERKLNKLYTLYKTYLQQISKQSNIQANTKNHIQNHIQNSHLAKKATRLRNILPRLGYIGFIPLILSFLFPQTTQQIAHTGRKLFSTTIKGYDNLFQFSRFLPLLALIPPILLIKKTYNELAQLSKTPISSSSLSSRDPSEISIKPISFEMLEKEEEEEPEVVSEQDISKLFQAPLVQRK